MISFIIGLGILQVRNVVLHKLFLIIMEESYKELECSYKEYKYAI